MAQALIDTDYDELAQDQLFMDLVEAHGMARAYNNVNDLLPEWANNLIIERDNEMEEGEHLMSPFNRLFFTYEAPGSRSDGYDETNIRYWENNDDISEFAHGPYAQRARDILRINEEIQDLLEDFDSAYELTPISPEITEALDAEVVDREEGFFMFNNPAFWRSQQRATLDHPDYEFMLRELHDQERIVANDGADFSDPDRTDFQPADGEEDLYNEIFNIDNQGGVIQGFTTNSQAMDRWIADGEQYIQDLQEALANFTARYVLPQPGEVAGPGGFFRANVDTDEVDREENVEEDRDVEDDIITPREGDEEIQGASRPDIIRLGTGRVGRPRRGQRPGVERLQVIRR